MHKKARSQTPRQRFSPQERQKMIIDGAIKFFAEHGFDGSTHQLAKFLGVTQPLIYQYFPTKEDLIDAAYQELFHSRWSDEWDGILADRSRPVEDRLQDFYERYCEVIHSPEWIRVFLYSGLKNLELVSRYTPMVEDRAIRRICIEAREGFGLPGLDKRPIEASEFEAVWTMHGGIFYYGVRRYVYNVPVEATRSELIRAAVGTFVKGYPGLMASLGVAGPTDM